MNETVTLSDTSSESLGGVDNNKNISLLFYDTPPDTPSSPSPTLGENAVITAADLDTNETCHLDTNETCDLDTNETCNLDTSETCDLDTTDSDELREDNTVEVNGVKHCPSRLYIIC